MPRDKAGWTPLHVAAEHERIASVVQLLRCERCEVDAPGPNGCTPLMLAAHAGSRKCAAALLAAGASLDRRDGGGATALLAAAAGRRAKAMRLLLQAGADPHCRDSSGSGAAFFAAKGGSAACVRLLREHGGENGPEGAEGGAGPSGSGDGRAAAGGGGGGLGAAATSLWRGNAPHEEQGALLQRGGMHARMLESGGLGRFALEN